MGTSDTDDPDEVGPSSEVTRRLAQIRAGVGQDRTSRGLKMALALAVVTAVLVLTWLITMAADVDVVINTEQSPPGAVYSTVTDPLGER